MSSKVYEIVTEKIVSLLDQDIVPWHKPWNARLALPLSVHGRPYRGINVFLLSAVQQAMSYTTPIWMTFKQAAELGGGVKPGEKSTLVVFWKMLDVQEKDKETGEEKRRRIPMLRYFNVFNLDQTGSVKLSKKLQALADELRATPELSSADADILAAIQKVSDGYENAPNVTHVAGAQAAYSPLLDVINIARQQDFESVSRYGATLFHEYTHSTGAEVRLNRPGVATFDHFGSDKYADEELVAELGAAFLCASAGISNNGEMLEDHAAYIKSWKQRLVDDPKLIVSAAGKAQKAADYILGVKFEGEVSA